MHARLLLLLLLWLPLSAAAIEQSLSGFVSLGLVASDNPSFAFRRDISQGKGSYDDHLSWRNDSLLGLKWQGRWSYQLDTTIQLVAKDRVDNTLGESIEWAFVHYRPKDGWDWRLGRLGVDIFMLSDYREVGYAFNWVRPPQDVYGPLSLYSLDGLDFNKRFDLQAATINLKLFYGHTRQTYPLDFGAHQVDSVDVNPGGLSLNLEAGDWKLRYSYVQVKINNNFYDQLGDALKQFSPVWPEASDLAQSISTRGSQFAYAELGLGYDSSSWWLQTELINLRSQSTLLPDSRHYYASLGRHFGPWLVYLNRSRAQPLSPPMAIAPPQGYPEPYNSQLLGFNQQLNTFLNGSRLIQRSWGLGLRWDFTSRMALKLQLDQVDFSARGSNLWLATQGAASVDQNSRVLSLSWDAIF